MDAVWKKPTNGLTSKIKNDGDDRGIIVYGYKFRPVMQKYKFYYAKRSPEMESALCFMA
jgi:hypothetical protein